MTSFDLSYDYRCPFAKNIHLHVLKALEAGADFDVTFVPWTLSQGGRDEGAPDVWNDPAFDEEHLSLAVSVSIRDQQPERFLAAHEALFRARHEQAVRLVTIEEIRGVLAPLGVDMDEVERDLQSRRPYEVMGKSYEEFTTYEAFGVPTFVVDGDATFVRYMSSPTDDGVASIKIIESMLTLMSQQSDLNEFKHTRLPY
ncbi:MAG: DsbA family protein [Acidimicrobiales bacterium]